MFNTPNDMSIYKRGIWLYLILLIFEGALRKWLLPSFATPLLLIREPIVVWLVITALFKGWLHSGIVIAVMAISTLSLLLSLIFGHSNIYVGLYGWRIYFFHIPFIFVMAKVLDMGDILSMSRFIIYTSIAMTVLIILQFYSPQDSWVNIGVGGDGSSGFSGAIGYFRPSGTFSFTSGYVMFQSLVGALLCFYLFMNDQLDDHCRLPSATLFIALGAYVISIPTSISRTHLFQSIIILLFVFIMALFRSRHSVKVITYLLLSIAVFVIMSSLGLLGESVEAFVARFKMASEIEGGVGSTIADRYIGGLLSSLFNFDMPISGYGIGLGTNAGANLVNIDIYSYFNGENEWSRVIGECGVLIGWTIIFIRLLIAFNLLIFSYEQMRSESANILPWFLSAAMLLSLPQGQMGVPTNLGFCIFIAGFTFASLKSRTIDR